METEDLMWKQIYNKLMESKKSEEEKTEHEIRYVQIFNEKIIFRSFILLIV